MPLSGYIRTFSFKTLFLIFSFSVVVFSLLGLSNPKEASARYGMNGTQCFFYYNNSSGQEQGLPVDERFCGGGGSNACGALEGGSKCETANVPGSSGATDGCDGITVTYCYDGGNCDQNRTPTNPAPTHVLFNLGCGHTWSERGPVALHMNIAYLEDDGGGRAHWAGIKRDGLGIDTDEFKVHNGDESRKVPISWLTPQMQDTTTEKAIVFYPNCAGGVDDAVESDCYRKKTLKPVIVDNNKPRCTIRAVNQGSDIRLDITANDASSGVARMGLFYRPVVPSGSSVTIYNNNYLVNPIVKDPTTFTHSYLLPRSSIDPNVYYQAILNIYDYKASLLYEDDPNRTDINANTVQCVTDLPCRMPLEQVDYKTSCTPGAYGNGNQIVSNVVEARNLRQAGYCQIDYVNISQTQNAPYPNYWNDDTNQNTLAIPDQFKKRDTGAPLVLQGRTTYWISYYDSESGQLSAGRSFVTRDPCPLPGIPSMVQGPQCRFYQADYATEPNMPLMDVVWNRPSSLGTGFLGYEVSVATAADPTKIVDTWAKSSDGSTVQNRFAIGAVAYRINIGTTYYYRARSLNWGGYSNWSGWTSGVLLRTKPNTPTGFRSTGANGGTGTAANPYINLDWDNPSSTAPVSVNPGWKLDISSTTTSVTDRPLADTPTQYTHSIARGASCNNTTYNYRLAGVNVCGTGPEALASAVCPANKTPTCSDIEYRDNVTGALWAPYPQGSTGLSRPASTSTVPSRIQLRRSCRDDDGNPMVYSWSSTCGTFSPSGEIIASGPSTTLYTFPTGFGLGCTIHSDVTDNYPNAGPRDSVVARTHPQPSVGTQTLSPGSRSIQWSNTSSSYAVVGGVTQNIATMNYTIADYVDRRDDAPTLNKSATLRINTTDLTYNGKINICHANYGVCKFSNGTATITTTAEDVTFPITINFTTAHILAIKDILVDTANTQSKYIINTTFTTSSGTVAPRTGTPGIVNNTPYCAGLEFTPVSPFGSTVSQVNIKFRARDDWGLKGIAVAYARTGTTAFSSIYTNANYFTSNPRTFDSNSATPIPWNIGSLTTSNRYSVRVTLSDADGASATCYANNNVIGSENPGGGGTTLPEVLIDRAAPQCNGSGLVINPSLDGTSLGFSYGGLDSGTSVTASGLDKVELLWRYASAGSTDPFQVYNTTDITGAQTYTKTIASNTAEAFSLNGRPSGQYMFAVTWTDRAGNTGTCNAVHEKGSRISAKVVVNAGVDGTTPLDYAYEADGTTQFRIGTKPSGAGAFTAGTWNLNGNTVANCTTKFPGTSTVDNCSAHNTSVSEFITGSTPVVELQFPKLTNATTIGKYRCTMKLFNTTNPSSWTQIGASTVDNGADGACSFYLPTNSLVVNRNLYSATGFWPTVVQFEVSYNSDQIHGQVRSEAGALITTGTVTTTNTLGTVTYGSGSVTSSGYSAPGGTNSAAYIPPSSVSATNVVTNGTYKASYSGTGTNRLCVWAARKNDAASMFTTNAQRTAGLGLFDSVSEIGAVARTMSASPNATEAAKWNVGVSATCTTTGQTLSNSRLSPGNQSQVNFMYLPKAKITGRVYVLESDGLCSSPSTWSDPANQDTAASMPVSIEFTTPATVGSNLNTPIITATANQNYEVYIDGLPNAGQFNNWIYTLAGSVPSNSRYIACPSTVRMFAPENIDNYPAESTVTAPIAFYLRETNDWWQTYNGGAHGFTSINNSIPASVDLPGEVLSGPSAYDLHTIVGEPNRTTAYTGIAAVKSSYATAAKGGLVSSTNALLPLATIVPGSRTRNWVFISSGMKGMRIPYTSGESPTSVTAVEKIKAIGGTEWSSDLNRLNSSGAKVLLTGGGTKNLDSVYTVGANSYLVVEGNLNINQNIGAAAATPAQNLFILATGDVTIANTVTDINAVIYTRGKITVASRGADSTNEVPLKVYGGLYANGNIVLLRDLANTDANWGFPSTQIFFDPALIISSRSSGFPSQLKEANVYWTQD